MNKDDILHLGTLARMAITEAEIPDLQKDISAVLAYVSTIDEVTQVTQDKQPGAVHNVFRADEVTVEPGSHSKALLEEAPQVEGDFLVVKKILNND